MSDFSIGLGKKLGAYALVLGAAHAIVGVMLFLRGEATTLGDLPRVAVLLVIAAVYLMSVGGLMQGRNEGLAFLMAGLLISAAVGGLYLLETGAQYMMYALGEAEGLSIVESINPATLLLVLALPLLPLVRRLTHGMVW
jgi:hypothetical protein